MLIGGRRVGLQVLLSLLPFTYGLLHDTDDPDLGTSWVVEERICRLDSGGGTVFVRTMF